MGQLLLCSICFGFIQALGTIRNLLRYRYGSIKNVVHTKVFLTNMEDYPAMNEAYAEFFSENYPASSVAQVATLPEGAHVSIEVIAVEPDK